MLLHRRHLVEKASERKSRSTPCNVLIVCLVVVVFLLSKAELVGASEASAVEWEGGSTNDPQSGDAPNSSVCRQALKRVPGHSAKCTVARDFRGCRFDSGFIPYLEFQYCQFTSPVPPTILMVLWLFTLLGAFAVIADSFFSPSLIALARSMHMSQNLAQRKGVTLLAFGNGAPDVFSAITAITTGDPEAPDEGLGLGFLMGSGLLVNTVTAGLIMLIKPFKTNRRPFIKDTLFYMSAVIWSASILIRRSIYLSDSIGFIMLYLLYVLTTWAASHIRLKKSNTKIYQRCSKFLKSLKIYSIFSRHSGKSKEVELKAKPASSNNSKTACKLRDRFRRLFKSRRAVTVAVEPPSADDVERGQTAPEDLKNPAEPSDVSLTGYRRRPDPMSISKGSNRNGGGSRSPSCFPRIEVTAPPTDGRSTSHSETSPQGMGSFRHTGLLEPPSRHVHRPFTPPAPLHSGGKPTHSVSRKCATPPSGLGSRRGSVVGGSHSITTNSSFRKRASVGGIGLRSRTPSVYQRRGSRRMSTMEQLPFVVRWIIANQEAENEETRESTNAVRLSLDERFKDHHLKKSLDMRRRFRHISDSTHAGDFSSLYTFTQDTSQPRSPAVSFVDDHSHSGFHPQGRHHHELQRISSVSLPDLDDINKSSTEMHPNTSAESGSRISLNAVVQIKPDVRFSRKNEVHVVEEEDGENGKRGSGDEDDDDDEGSQEYVDPFIEWARKNQWHHLLYCLCPIDLAEWHDLSIPVKVIQILQAPIFILFRLTIPVVYEDLEPTPPPPSESEIKMYSEGIDEGDLEVGTTANDGNGPDGSSRSLSAIENDPNEETRSYGDSPLVDFEDLHGWCRLLNCFQCLLTPMLWVLLVTVGGTPLGLYKVGNSNLPVVVIVLLISMCIAITIFVTSRWDKAPSPYHRPFFATLGFITSVVWIYAIAHELVNSLEALGIVWEISEAILGITVMAFASSIGDLMSNSLLAHNGYPRIAYAACSGAPLFNLLIGAGASYTIKLARSGDHNAAMSFTLTHILLFSFLLGVLVMNLIVAFSTGFRMHRAYGGCLLAIYASFMVMAILVEADIITPPKHWHLSTGTE